MAIIAMLLTLDASRIGTIFAGAVCGAAFVIITKRLAKRRNDD